MLSRIGRAAIKRVAAGSRLHGAGISRDQGFQTKRIASSHIASHLPKSRTYATATATKTPAKKTTAAKKTAGAKKSTNAKTPAKKPASRSLKAPPKKLAAKPQKKVTSKAKTKRKGLTQDQKNALALRKVAKKEKAAELKVKQKEKAVAAKAREKAAAEKKKAKAASVQSKLDLENLKVAALVPPTRKPNSSWTVFSAREMASGDAKGKPAGSQMPMIAAKYKALSAEEQEDLTNIGLQNVALNKSEFTKWVESHTPSEIFEANKARSKLRRLTGQKWPKILDNRIPTRNSTPWVNFLREKTNSPQFDGVKPLEIWRALSPVWKSLSDAERQPYVDMAAAHKLRYEQEYKTVLHRDTPGLAKAKAS